MPARVLLAFCLAIAGPAAAQAPELKSVAVLDFELANDMKDYDAPEVTAAQERRLRMISAALREEFRQRGMYRVMDNDKAGELIASLKKTYDLRNCAGCELDVGKALGADRVVIAWVQKVSNLILNLNIEVKDVQSGEMVYNKSVDLRGNTDESWMRGIHYMVDSIAEKKQHLR